MKLWRASVLFYLGGCGYMALELLWRGRTDGSMFLAGGLCFLLLGQLQAMCLPLPLRGLLGAGAITAVELGIGLVFNRDYRVWDYRSMPGNFLGQICPLFSFLWVFVSVLGMYLYGYLDKQLPGRQNRPGGRYFRA